MVSMYPPPHDDLCGCRKSWTELLEIEIDKGSLRKALLPTIEKEIT